MQPRDTSVPKQQSPHTKTKVRKVGPYLLVKVIGKGSYSTVFEGKLESTNRRVAVKQIDLTNVKKKELERIQLEIRILSHIKHENIVELIDYKKSARHLYLIFEHCENTDLQKHIRKYYGGPMPEQDARNFFLQIKEGFQVLRRNRVVHRDLKLANLLVTKDFIVKIADFGFAKPLEDDQMLKSWVGTPLTMAPEVFDKKVYNEKCDIWSLGIILYQMLFAQNPFVSPDKMTVQGLKEGLLHKKLEFSPTVSVSDCVKNLLSRMLEKDANKRMSFEEFFDHEWLVEPFHSLSLSESSEEKSIRNVVLAKEVKSYIGHKSDEEIRETVKYLDKILVYKTALLIRNNMENRLFGYATLAKKLISVQQQMGSESSKKLLFAGLALLGSNLRQAQNSENLCSVNNTPARFPSYNILKSLVMLPTQSEFSRNLSMVINKSMNSIIQELKNLQQQQPSCQKLLSTFEKKGITETYLTLLMEYLEGTVDKSLLQVLIKIKEFNIQKQQFITLSSRVLSKDVLNIVNSQTIWRKAQNVGRVCSEDQFIRQYNSNNSLFQLETKAVGEQQNRQPLDLFYNCLKELI